MYICMYTYIYMYIYLITSFHSLNLRITCTRPSHLGSLSLSLSHSLTHSLSLTHTLSHSLYMYIYIVDHLLPLTEPLNHPHSPFPSRLYSFPTPQLGPALPAPSAPTCPRLSACCTRPPPRACCVCLTFFCVQPICFIKDLLRLY